LKELTGTQLQAADVDGSGSADVTDALMVLQKYVGLLQVFPVEE